MTRRSLLPFLFATCVVVSLAAQPRPDGTTENALRAEQFSTLHTLIKPLPGEFAWYEEIPWLTSVSEARERAAAEGKPLLIWSSADGQPCGAT